MNKFVRFSIILLLVILIVGGGIYFKMFSIGSYVVSDVTINKVTVGNNDVTVDGILTSSGSAYKDYDYQLVGSELYINVRKVLVSNKYDSGKFKISIPVNGSSIQDIYLSDGKNTKVIYSKNNLVD